MKKIFSIALFFAFVGCEAPQADRIESSDHISQHPAFLELMSNYQDVLRRFNILCGSSASEKQAYHQGLKLLVDSNAPVGEISQYLGYSSSEFTSFGTKVRKSVSTLLTTFPGLNNFDERGRAIFVEATKIYLLRNSNPNHQTLSFGRTNVEEPSGCAGGQVCIRQAVDCDNKAETDFAIGSAICSSSYGWFPPSWAVCQGTVFLAYSAEKLDCAHKLELCCNLGGSTNPV